PALPVVTGGEGADPLVHAHAEAVQGLEEGAGAVAGAVVGDDPGDPVDAVGGAERPRSGHKSDRGAGLLVGQVLGVGQPGEPVHGGVQVDVAGADRGVGRADVAPLAGPAGGPVGCGTPAVGAPASTVGDPAYLLHVHVDHVPGIPGDDLLRGLPVRGARGVQVTQPADAQAPQPAPDGALADGHTPGAQLGPDRAGRPLLVPPQP